MQRGRAFRPDRRRTPSGAGAAAGPPLHPDLGAHRVFAVSPRTSFTRAVDLIKPSPVIDRVTPPGLGAGGFGQPQQVFDRARARIRRGSRANDIQAILGGDGRRLRGETRV